jgi:FkbM family methyltransferase
MAIELPSYLNLQQCRHGPMLYPRTDKYVGRSLELYGEFSEGEHELFTQLVGPGAVIVEVGANIGAHTVGLAKLVGPTGAVISFEPQPVLFQIMTANMALNGLSNARPVLAGLAERGGTLKLPLIDYTRENNFGAFQLSENGDDIVEVRTLDSYGLTRLTLLKIDVEGMEQNVIDGARETIARHRPMMYVENDRKEKSRALIEAMQGWATGCGGISRPCSGRIITAVIPTMSSEPSFQPTCCACPPRCRRKSPCARCATPGRHGLMW